jgi:D-alanyl-D-alanine carboxypeptidase (penicillin-binding protein 5/6)
VAVVYPEAVWYSFVDSSDIDDIVEQHLQQGQVVGTLRVTNAAGAVVADKPLLALDAVEEAGIIGRSWDALRLMIK